VSRGIRTLFVCASLLAVAQASFAQGRAGGLPDSVKAKRWEVENELHSLAVVDRKVMITMRDGIRIPAHDHGHLDGIGQVEHAGRLTPADRVGGSHEAIPDHGDAKGHASTTSRSTGTRLVT